MPRDLAREILEKEREGTWDVKDFFEYLRHGGMPRRCWELLWRVWDRGWATLNSLGTLTQLYKFWDLGCILLKKKYK